MHGYQHTAVNLAATAGICGTLCLLNRPVTAAALGAGLVFGTLLVTPDLDLHLNDARRRWGRWRFIWGPYAHLSRHRGLSHSYLAGPLIRLAYLLAWLSPVLVVLVSAGLPSPVTPVMWKLALLVMIGYLLAQWLHLLCDGIIPGRPRRAGRRPPRH